MWFHKIKQSIIFVSLCLCLSNDACVYADQNGELWRLLLLLPPLSIIARAFYYTQYLNKYEKNKICVEYWMLPFFFPFSLCLCLSRVVFSQFNRFVHMARCCVEKKKLRTMTLPKARQRFDAIFCSRVITHNLRRHRKPNWLDFVPI